MSTDTNPRATCALDLSGIIADYHSIEVPEMGFDGLEEAAEFERAEATAALAGQVLAAVSALAGTWENAATTLEGIERAENDPEQEHDEEIAAYLRDCATDLRRMLA